MASEIYGVGVLLYFLVSGSYPVEGDTRTVIRQLHSQLGARKPLRDVRPDLPDPFIRVVEQALAERPEDRYASAGALETALTQVLPGSRPSKSQPFPVLKLVLVGFALLVLGVSGLTLRGLRSSPGDTKPQDPAPDAGARVVPVTPGLSPAIASSSAEYRIDAAFYREHTGAIERLKPGTRLARDESLSLQVEVSAPAYLYVVNEDDKGESYLLFPLPGLALSNPLQPGQRHRLPGMWNGEAISWQVTSEGDREHFLIVASPERSLKFEEMFATLPRPSFGGPPARRLSTDELGVLRSVGGLTTSPTKGDRQLRMQPEFSTPLAGSEELVRGVWIRHATFENPVK
jgi:hypothetical protein